MKKLSTLLTQREALLRQVRLANLAFAYTTLEDFVCRIARAQLRGRVALQHAAPDEERYWASLTAIDGNQSVIEEHFSDEDIMDLADVIAFSTANEALDLTFRLEELGEVFLTPLRAELAGAGIALDRPGATSDAVI
ncbi:MAG: hypothetical protein EXS37_21710 [Opitutus sp.]|nr:hypothetical protein [Opitutus sp.]